MNEHEEHAYMAPIVPVKAETPGIEWKPVAGERGTEVADNGRTGDGHLTVYIERPERLLDWNFKLVLIADSWLKPYYTRSFPRRDDARAVGAEFLALSLAQSGDLARESIGGLVKYFASKLTPAGEPKPDDTMPEQRTASKDYACDSKYACEGISAGDEYVRRAIPPRSHGNPDPHFDHERWCMECVERETREVGR